MKNKVIILLLTVFISGCKYYDDVLVEPEFHATPYAIDIPPGFPTILNIPEDNPMTLEGIDAAVRDLGR